MGAVLPGADADVLSRGPAAFRHVDWLERDIAVERRPDGTIRMKSRIPLAPFERHVSAFLTRWAQERPDQVWLAQRAGSGWQELTRIQALAVKTTGLRIVFTTTFGATETAPAATMSYWNAERVGLIGLPCPGVELKLLPVTDGKYEVRIKSVAVTPGYQNQPDLTAAAFDEEGFYKVGDLVEFVKSGRPAEGLAFAGRLVEDFKLPSGTFVLVGALRVDAITAASPLILDALVAGQDRDEVGLLAWPHLEACRSFIGDRTATIDEVVGNREIRDAIRWGLHSHNEACGNAGSRRIGRALLLSEPPSIDHNEITDNGYINQRAGLTRRSAAVERLYADPVASDVIIIPR